VLGGGGAKGAAHIGVLQVMEQMNVPVDCVVGTSMGALVGGIYASGMSAEDLNDAARKIDWNRTLGSKGKRESTPIEIKTESTTYTNDIEIGIENGKLTMPSGLVGTQNVNDVIAALVADGRGEKDFDKLPIPFRAIATDMIDAKMHVFDSGDIAVAMRASMAVPGAFSPIVIGDKVYSDGGMMRNLPVDVGRELCADVVIAVWLTTPPPTVDSLQSPVALASRSNGVMIDANENAQIATLTDQDVGIEVKMGDIGTASFDRVPDAIDLGRAAAEAARESLARYAVPAAEYAAWRESINVDVRDGISLDEVRIVGLDRVNQKYVANQLKDVQGGSTVAIEEITDAAGRIYALGDFDKVSYNLLDENGKSVLEFRPVEKSNGPHFFKFDLGLAGQGKGDLMAIVRGEHKATWINSLGARWHNIIQAGRQTILRTDFYQPLNTNQSFFIQPILNYGRNLEDIYIDGSREARYYFSEFNGQLDAGINIGNIGQIKAGAYAGWIDSEQDTGGLLLPELDKERESTAVASLLLDTRDDAGLPTKGGYLNVRYANSGSWLSGDQKYSLGEGVATYAIPFGRNTISLIAGGGTRFSGDLPVNRQFTLGGIRSFPGLRLNELRGDSYWVAGAGYQYKLADILPVFDKAFYGGLRAQAGRVGNRVDSVADGTLYGLSGNIGARTPAGPFLLSLGYVTNSSWELQFSFGRPLSEGNIADKLE